MSAFEETAVQTITIDTTRQLVDDRRAALGATVRRARLRRLLSRANGPQSASLDLVAVEIAEATTPAVIVGPRAAGPDVARVDKVA